MEDFFNRSSQSSQQFVPEERKKELILDFDSFNVPAHKKDLFATAQLLLNILLTVPGTYPDTPGLGVDIRKYQYEFLSDDNIRSIQGAIEEQARIFLPTAPILQILVQVIKSPASNTNTLGIGFAVGSSASQSQNLFVFFDQDANKNVKVRLDI